MIESGLTLVGKQGFAGSGVADITALADVPKGSFYQYFESKHAYAIELLEDYWSSIESRHALILHDTQYRPLDRITRHFRAIGQDHKRQKFVLGCLIGNLGIEIADTGEEARTKLRQVVKNWASLLADCLKQAQAADDLDHNADVQEISAALIDAWEGAAIRAKVERSGAAYKRFETIVLPRLLGQIGRRSTSAET